VSTLNNFYSATNDKSRHDNYLSILDRNSEYAGISRGLGAQLMAYAKANDTKRSAMKADLVAMINEFFETTYGPAEMDVLINGLDLYAAKANYELANGVAGLYADGSTKNEVRAMFAMSILASKNGMLAFLEAPSEGQLSNDPLYKLSADMFAQLMKRSDELIKLTDDYNRAYRLLVAGLRESGMSTILYPDANSTLRLTYGYIRSYSPNDGESHSPYTSLDGIFEKANTSNDYRLPSMVADKLRKENIPQIFKDPKTGKVVVGILYNMDTTGGNSGSPVLNAQGELIGINFDRSFTATINDFAWNEKYSRSIGCDIRYVIYVLKYVSEADHILKELNIAL
jgi:hypothetical protein